MPTVPTVADLKKELATAKAACAALNGQVKKISSELGAAKAELVALRKHVGDWHDWVDKLRPGGVFDVKHLKALPKQILRLAKIAKKFLGL